MSKFGDCQAFLVVQGNVPESYLYEGQTMGPIIGGEGDGYMPHGWRIVTVPSFEQGEATYRAEYLKQRIGSGMYAVMGVYDEDSFDLALFDAYNSVNSSRESYRAMRGGRD